MKNLKSLIGILLLTGVPFLSNAQVDPELKKACNASDLTAVKKAVEAGADVNAVRADGVPVLGEASFSPEITQYLIDKGADPNGGTFSAILVAAASYSTEVMEVLLKNGADPNKGQEKTSYHPIATMIKSEEAKKKPNKKLLKQWKEQLSAAGGTMEPVKSTVSPLENTVNTTNCVPCIELLLKNGADPKVTDAVGNDMITNSVLRSSNLGPNFITYGKTLTSWGVKVPDWWNERVVKGTSAQEVELLIKYGADVNYLNPVNDNTPLLAALGGRNADAAKLLIQNGADVTVLTPNKKDALSVATELGDLELVKLTVEKGADVNRETWGLDPKSGQYAKGFTPLTIAVVHNHIDIAKYLMEAGSKPKEGVSGYHVSAKTGCPYKLKNKTAIYYAVENNNMDMVKMLTENFKSWNKTKMEMNQPDNTNTIDAGSIRVEVTSCWKIKGVFTPSAYAKKIEHKEISTYLKSKGL